MAKNNLIQVGGELVSTDYDGIVADAAAVKDYTQGREKTQKEVNDDVETELANRYTKQETYNKSELNNMVAPQHDYVIVSTYADLANITEHTEGCVYRVSNYDGINNQVDATMYSEYSWDGTQYIHLATKSQIGEVFDVSAYNATGGTLATYDSLDALLSRNDLNTVIPIGVRRGGMSIKFVSTSDNKYVQFRCIADEFTTDVTQWAIAEEGVYVENPEFVYVKTDAKDKILWAIKTDGSIYYGAGVPPQVIDYIQQKIDELSLDEYEDIVTFLDGLEEGDITLRTMLTNLNTAIGNEVIRATTAEGTKVDKVAGKSLIDTGYAESMSSVENPEWMDVKTDNEDRILEGIQQDGTKVIGGDINVGGSASIKGDIKLLGNMEVSGVSYKVIKNQEYLAAWVDAANKVIFGIKADGKTYVGDADFLNSIKDNQEAIRQINSNLAIIGAKVDFLDIDALYSITATENPEYIEAKTDSEGKLIAGRTPDGAAFENVGFSTPEVSVDGYIIKNIEDPEGRSKITTDSEGKIISYRDSEGVRHENVGVKTPNLETEHLELTNEGLNDLGRALKAGGYANLMDWSDKKFVEIPLPQTCAILNFGVNSQATSKSDRVDYQEGVNGDIPTTIEFWDMQGNYFKKPILLSAQGNSSIIYWIKNQAFDLDDDSNIKFGNWVAQDSFHVKKYYIDVFRGQCIAAYWLTEQVYQTRSYGERRPWDYLNHGGDTQNAIGNFKKDFDTGALAHPDAFPVHVFFNGNDAGVYAFALKKHRDNYYCKKDNTNQIILDGEIGVNELFGGNIDWTAFEIRNPKTKKKKDGWELVDVNGKKYNGDFPTELMGSTTQGYDSTNQSHVKSAETKDNIERLSGARAAITANRTKATFEQYFIVPFFIDYFLISQVLYHFDGFWKNWIWCTWDGQKWAPTIYDMDSIFGSDTNGTNVIPSGEYLPIGQRVGGRENTNQIMSDNAGLTTFLWELYQPEVKERYAYLRENGIFTTENIVSLLETWVKKCGYDNLKNDIDTVCAFDGVPQTPSYRDGSATYSQTPTTGGFYNSILRVKRWLDGHFDYLDSASVFNYNQN